MIPSWPTTGWARLAEDSVGAAKRIITEHSPVARAKNHNRNLSTTAAANFQSLVTESSSSWLFSLLVMKRNSFRIDRSSCLVGLLFCRESSFYKLEWLVKWSSFIWKRRTIICDSNWNIFRPRGLIIVKSRALSLSIQSLMTRSETYYIGIRWYVTGRG